MADEMSRGVDGTSHPEAGSGDSSTTEPSADSTPTAESSTRVISTHDAIRLAVNFHQNGRLGEAEALYRRVLEAEQDQPDALHYLGVLSHQLGKSDVAIEMIERSLELVPENAAAHNNLGNIYKELGRFEEARDKYERVIALRPDSADSYNNLATVFRVLEMFPEAERACRRAIDLDPKHADAHHNLGNALFKLNRQEDAAESYRRSIALKPDQGSAYHSLAAYLSHNGRFPEAAKVLREWLVYEPENPVPQHLLAACTHENVPGRASDEFVKAHFDSFASRFDRHLAGLGYQAPQLVADALARALGSGECTLDVLDAGCGTGLAAPLLRPYARRLDGIDLSVPMLEKAKERGGYDRLEAAELTAHLRQLRSAYDLIVSIDTLCYFGNLEEVARGFAQALRPGGSIAFSVERIESDEEPFGLLAHGRYAHGRPYLESVLESAGFRIQEIEHGVLRQEVGNPVDGWIVTATLPKR